jgi:hypothetical protein
MNVYTPIASDDNFFMLTFYSLLFAFNVFAHVPYKDSCISITLHRSHRKFIVNKHNFK